MLLSPGYFPQHLGGTLLYPVAIELYHEFLIPMPSWSYCWTWPGMSLLDKFNNTEDSYIDESEL